jgi:hypothetical protein
MIGLRFRVGADWPTYLHFFDVMSQVDLAKAMRMTDPLYGAINWVVDRLGGAIWVVNLICATIFISGLVSFSRWQPNPALAMLVAIPYLVTVVGMGYTRQSAALGIIMIALTRFHRSSTLGTMGLLFLSVLFHKSAMILVPLFGISMSRGRFTTFVGFAVLALLLYYLFAAAALDRLVNNYIEEERSSAGALIRITMNLVPSVMYLAFRNRFGLDSRERTLWALFALSSIAALIFLAISPSSTAVDRMALYLIPIQVLVLSRVPVVLGPRGRESKLAVVAVIFYSLLIQLVWLLFAGHSENWIPYRNYLWMSYDTMRVNGE